MQISLLHLGGCFDHPFSKCDRDRTAVSLCLSTMEYQISKIQHTKILDVKTFQVTWFVEKLINSMLSAEL